MALFDPDVSENSYGFRPGRSAHDAVKAARAHVASGRRFVVDMDLEKFFDRVDHDVLMARVARKVADKRVLRLVRPGRSVAATIKDLAPVVRGWIGYFRLAEAKGIFEDLDGWLRRRLRCVLWRRWKRRPTRAERMMQRGIAEERAWRSAYNGRGPWWNAGASHMDEAFKAAFFANLGLPSLQMQHRRRDRVS